MKKLKEKREIEELEKKKITLDQEISKEYAKMDVEDQKIFHGSMGSPKDIDEVEYQRIKKFKAEGRTLEEEMNFQKI